MSEERQNERDSQLSAMFDGELPGAECELLARRLTRDEVLRAQWSRFSMIGAALRAERGVALHDRVAWRVQSMVAQEATYGDGTVDSAATSRTAVIVPASELKAASAARWLRFARPVAGASIAAGVAAMSIFWLRTQDDSQTHARGQSGDRIHRPRSPTPPARPVALSTAPAAEARASNGEPDRYVTPAPSSSASIVPPARLANYVVAHSEYSGPLSRRMALLGLVATDPSEVPAILRRGVRRNRPPQELSMRRDSRYRSISRGFGMSQRNGARFVALALLLGAGVAFGAEPKEWLERMNKALTTRNYVGVFTHVHGGRVETLRIIHRVRGRDVSERLLSLDGSGREFIREGTEVTCYFPDRRTVLVERRAPDGPLLGALPAIDDASSQVYEIRGGERERLLGRYDARGRAASP